MKITIDTQLATEQEVKVLLKYLKKEDWDYHKEGIPAITSLARRRT